VEIESLAASDIRVPAAAVSVVGAAGLGAGGLAAGWDVFFSGAGLAASVGGGGTSFIAAVDSVGASVRLRAVESADWFAWSLLTHPAKATAVSSATRCEECF